MTKNQRENFTKSTEQTRNEWDTLVDQLTVQDAIDRITINHQLEAEVFRNAPENLSEMELGVYTYIKMCRTLTYDPEFFVKDRSQVVANDTWTDPSRVSEITPENNAVVCWEFNAIYGKFLKQMGVKPISAGKYGKGHSRMKFSSGGVPIKTDAVIAALDSDLTLAKLGYPLRGIVCGANNADSKKQFQDAYDTVYGLIKSQDADKFCPLEISPSDYELKTDYYLAKICNTGLPAMDALAYALKYRDTMFTYDERRRQFAATILRENSAENSFPTVVFTQSRDIQKPSQENIFASYTPPDLLVSYSEEEIRRQLADGTYEFLEGLSDSIPGISPKD